ncbi:MAG: CpsB/CapC family capsule biosynthesis tyrosine phosphatase [Lachnospiraceae bacterium]|nr:CpsB/CapC family capsule biosynthesis tyrosine phosphatase [Lachnospiraceae bacterium]
MSIPKICDMHCHVLPGIDDGSKSWEMSMRMLKKSWDAGVRAVIATPHYLPWRHTIIAKDVPVLCQEATRRFKEEFGLDLPIYPGQELYYHIELVSAIEEGKALTLNGTRYVLVEFAEEENYSVMVEAAESLLRNGYQPIFAHVERFSALRNEKNLDDILGRGVLLQSNFEEPSNGGFLNGTVRWLAKRYKREEISFLGSDMHNLTKRMPVTSEQLEWFDKHLDEEYFQEIAWKNAEKIFHPSN